MAKKKAERLVKIPIEEIEVNGVYKTYVNDIVKVLSIDKEKEQFVLMNITGSFKQWIDFKNIFLVTRFY
jgi:hypothetical protein